MNEKCMIKQKQFLLITNIFYLIILVFLISCNREKQENKTKLNTAVADKSIIKATAKIRFFFTAKPINIVDKSIEIKATLFNDNVDTVYFLSTTCEGAQYSLHYDTAKFTLTPSIVCNASYPKIIKIAPKGLYDFKAHFKNNSKETKIKLGFDFYSVDKAFDLKNKNLRELNIFNRPENKQTIIWADEKTIQ